MSCRLFDFLVQEMGLDPKVFAGSVNNIRTHIYNEWADAAWDEEKFLYWFTEVHYVETIHLGWVYFIEFRTPMDWLTVKFYSPQPHQRWSAGIKILPHHPKCSLISIGDRMCEYGETNWEELTATIPILMNGELYDAWKNRAIGLIEQILENDVDCWCVIMPSRR